MKSKISPNDLTGVFNEVISLLEKNLKYIELLNWNPTAARAYKKTIAYLKRRSPEEIDSILGTSVRNERSTTRYSDPELTDAEITNLTGVDIKPLLSSPSVSRTFLERLASLRFGVTKGALSMLRSRHALVDKLNTLIDHEGTHAAISRAAGSGENGPR